MMFVILVDRASWSKVMPYHDRQLEGSTIDRAYERNEDLPEEVRRDLPPVVQDIFREAYNLAWAREYARSGTGRAAGELAMTEAWARVREAYTQIGTTWVRNRDV